VKQDWEIFLNKLASMKREVKDSVEMGTSPPKTLPLFEQLDPSEEAKAIHSDATKESRKRKREAMTEDEEEEEEKSSDKVQKQESKLKKPKHEVI